MSTKIENPEEKMYSLLHENMNKEEKHGGSLGDMDSVGGKRCPPVAAPVGLHPNPVSTAGQTGS